MKRFYLFTLFTLLVFNALKAQSQHRFLVASDTIFQEHVTIDEFNFLDFPSGADTNWVNFGLDPFLGKCVQAGPTPTAWFIESDLGEPGSENLCFTSCSYFDDNPAIQSMNQNWLILPPTYIPNAACYLSWRSLSLLGPAFHDGYKVLVSRLSNDPYNNEYTDTLFVMAEMVSSNDPEYASTDLSDYTFSPGYIQANGYTDPNYYFEDDPMGGAPLFYHGKLEPHTADLSAYAEQTIYIAFLHDSTNDYLLQIDDIAVVNTISSITTDPGVSVRLFEVSPTITQDQVSIRLSLSEKRDVMLTVQDATGRTLCREMPGTDNEFTMNQSLQAFPEGMYFISVFVDGATFSKKVVKRN